MIFTNKDDFLQTIEEQKRILALDIGKKNIGVAISDRSKMLASSLMLIKRSKFMQDIEQIFSLYNDNNCGGLVIGLPLLEEGDANPMEQSIRQFARNLLKERELPIYFQDEKFSSVEAENVLLSADVSRQKRIEKIDKTAAAIILQRFLEE